MKIINPIAGSPFRKPTRKALPIYVAITLALLVFIQLERFDKFRQNRTDVLRRIWSSQTTGRPTHGSRFPKKIWQTWKLDALDLEERDLNRARSWTQINRNFRYEIMTDDNDLEYVETHFGPGGVVDRPDIVETYRSLQTRIIKADLLRYLLMYIEGGVYADIDVEALRDVDHWIPRDVDERDVGLVIGVEIDEPSFANHTILGPKSRSFCQWTFMCKPRHPAIMRIIEHVIHWLNEVSQNQNVPISDIVLNFDEVITGTGPSAFTGAILKEMAAQTGGPLHWDTFHAIKQPVLVGDILVLTVEAFAAGQGHSDSGNHDSEFAVVKHHYHASLWPSKHPRYSHPAYGMVEECNWAPECVEDWTANTAAFDRLSYDEKLRLIDEKAGRDKEKFDKEQAEQAQADQDEADRRTAETKATCEEASYFSSTTCRADLCQSVTEAFKTQPADENGMITVVIQAEAPAHGAISVGDDRGGVKDIRNLEIDGRS